MNEISNLCTAVADAINSANLFPQRVEFRANFKTDVERFRGDFLIYVCPHSQSRYMESRSTQMRTISVDVVLQYKLKAESQEDAVRVVGAEADKVDDFLFNRDIGPYRFVKSDYYPYHGDSLEQTRVFVSMITVAYRAMGRFDPKKADGYKYTRS